MTIVTTALRRACLGVGTNRAIISRLPSNRNRGPASSQTMESTSGPLDRGAGRLTERLDLRFAVRFGSVAGALFGVYAFPF